MAKKSQPYTDKKTGKTYMFDDNGHGDLYNGELDMFLIFTPYPWLTETVTHKDGSATMNRKTFNETVKENKGVFEKGYEENDDGTVFVKKEDIPNNVNEKVTKEDNKVKQEKQENKNLYDTVFEKNHVMDPNEFLKSPEANDYDYENYILGLSNQGDISDTQRDKLLDKWKEFENENSEKINTRPDLTYEKDYEGIKPDKVWDDDEDINDNLSKEIKYQSMKKEGEKELRRLAKENNYKPEEKDIYPSSWNEEENTHPQNLIDEIKNYKQKDSDEYHSAKEAFLSRMNYSYNSRKDEFVEDMKNLRILEESEDYVLYGNKWDTGETWTTIISSYDPKSRFQEMPNIYYEKTYEGGIKPGSAQVNWGAYGSVNPERAKEFVSKLQKAVDFAERLNRGKDYSNLWK